MWVIALYKTTITLLFKMLVASYLMLFSGILCYWNNGKSVMLIEKGNIIAKLIIYLYHVYFDFRSHNIYITELHKMCFPVCISFQNEWNLWIEFFLIMESQNFITPIRQYILFCDIMLLYAKEFLGCSTTPGHQPYYCSFLYILYRSFEYIYPEKSQSWCYLCLLV